MPVRTLNYTNRKRIRREDARVTIREKRDGYAFDIALRLAGYALPGDAKVYLEAHRQGQYMRFDVGQIGALRISEDRLLRDFDSIEGVLFRIKVVASGEPHGLLLAEADQIRPRDSDTEDDGRICLLRVKSDENMGDEVWQLEFDDHQALLKVNSKLGDWRAVARDRVFLALVYPSILRSVLLRILAQEKHWDTEDPEDWRSRWLRFAESLPGVGGVPSGSDEACLEDWIEDAVAAFCRCHKMRATFERYWTETDDQ